MAFKLSRCQRTTILLTAILYTQQYITELSKFQNSLLTEANICFYGDSYASIGLGKVMALGLTARCFSKSTLISAIQS